MDARDHDQLPLDLTGTSLLDGPFTPAMARGAGISRWVLERMAVEGRVRRLLRGVYLAPTVAETLEVRARAVGLVVPAEAVVVDRTAAWLHGIDLPVEPSDPVPPVEAVVLGPRGRTRRSLSSRDVTTTGGVRLTTPLRTALDLGRLLAPDRAQGVLDTVLREGRCTHRELLAELSRFSRHGGIVQLRHVVALADARSHGAAESALRFRWFTARMPTPVPGLVVEGTGLRLALGLPVQRFGVVLGHADRAQTVAAEARGWRVVAVDPEQVLHGDADLVVHRLEGEYFQQLLRDVC